MPAARREPPGPREEFNSPSSQTVCLCTTFVQPARGPRRLHGGSVAKKLPARPNLEHLRGQAKTLLTTLKRRHKGARLADAQLDVARDWGFKSWPALTRHVEQLRALEGEWRFTGLEIEGTPVPPATLTQSRILIDGDRFRSESPEATYDGIFTIDVEASPARIHTTFREAREACTD